MVPSLAFGKTPASTEAPLWVLHALLKFTHGLARTPIGFFMGDLSLGLMHWGLYNPVYLGSPVRDMFIHTDRFFNITARVCLFLHFFYNLNFQMAAMAFLMR